MSGFGCFAAVDLPGRGSRRQCKCSPLTETREIGPKIDKTQSNTRSMLQALQAEYARPGAFIGSARLVCISFGVRNTPRHRTLRRSTTSYYKCPLLSLFLPI